MALLSQHLAAGAMQQAACTWVRWVGAFTPTALASHHGNFTHSHIAVTAPGSIVSQGCLMFHTGCTQAEQQDNSPDSQHASSSTVFTGTAEVVTEKSPDDVATDANR